MNWVFSVRDWQALIQIFDGREREEFWPTIGIDLLFGKCHRRTVESVNCAPA